LRKLADEGIQRRRRDDLLRERVLRPTARRIPVTNGELTKRLGPVILKTSARSDRQPENQRQAEELDRATDLAVRVFELGLELRRFCARATETRSSNLKATLQNRR